MNCPNCKTANRDGAKRCRQCGTALPAAQAPQAPAPMYPPQPQAPVQPPYPQQPQAPYQPQQAPYQPAPQAQPPQLTPPAQAGGTKRLPWKNIGLGCLLLLAGFIVGISSILIAQAINPPSATPTAVATSVSGGATPGAASAPTAMPTPARPDKGGKAPTFTLKDTANADKELASMINGKLAVLVFWTSSLGDDQIASLKKFVDDGRGIVIGVNSDESLAKVNKFIGDKGLQKFTLLLDGEGKVKDEYKVTETPTYILIGKDGVITERLGAGTTRADLDKKLGELK